MKVSNAKRITTSEMPFTAEDLTFLNSFRSDFDYRFFKNNL